MNYGGWNRVQEQKKKIFEFHRFSWPVLLHVNMNRNKMVSCVCILFFLTISYVHSFFFCKKIHMCILLSSNQKICLYFLTRHVFIEEKEYNI